MSLAAGNEAGTDGDLHSLEGLLVVPAQAGTQGREQFWITAQPGWTGIRRYAMPVTTYAIGTRAAFWFLQRAASFAA
jgi:hypothetical protein